MCDFQYLLRRRFSAHPDMAFICGPVDVFRPEILVQGRHDAQRVDHLRDPGVHLRRGLALTGKMK